MNEPTKVKRWYLKRTSSDSTVEYLQAPVAMTWVADRSFAFAFPSVEEAQVYVLKHKPQEERLKDDWQLIFE
jgi:hypothetical protein